MNRLFNMDNKFFTTMSRIADLMLLNFLCLICCIPIITAGASITALYSVMLKVARNEESYITRSFFKAFKENFKQATIIWVVFLIVGTIIYFDYNIAPRLAKGNLSYAFQVLFVAFGVVFCMMASYVFPILAQFDNSVKNTVKNSLLMAIRHLPYTIIMVVLNAIPFFGFSISPYFVVYGTIFYLAFGFGFTAFINSKILAKVFKSYMPEDDAESIGDALENKSELEK